MDTPSKRQVLWLLLVAECLLGMGSGFFPEATQGHRLWTLVSFVVTIVLCMRWFALDARLHNYRISGPMYLCLVALLAFTAPFYFFATRRFGFWKSLLKSVGFFVVLFVVGATATLITQALLGTLPVT